jgi:hypothetical protein
MKNQNHYTEISCSDMYISTKCSIVESGEINVSTLLDKFLFLWPSILSLTTFKSILQAPNLNELSF